MAAPLHELEAQVLNLGSAERALLLERLIESFEPDTKTQQAWIAEALRREADVKAGKSKMASSVEVMARVRARIE